RPAFNGLLNRPRDGQLARRCILGQRGTSPQRGALPHAHGRDQLRIGTDKGIVLDHRQRFVDAIVIAGNGAGANIDACPDLGIANIRQVIGLGALAKHAFLDFDKIAHMRLGTDPGTRAKARVRPDTRLFGHVGFLNMTECLNMGTRTDHRVFDDAMRADTYAVSQFDLAFKHAADVNKDVSAAYQRTAQIKTGRVRQRYARLQQTTRLLALPAAFQLGLLY